MKHIIFTIFLFVLMSAIIIVGCKSNDSPSTPIDTPLSSPTATPVVFPGDISGTITGLSNDQAGKSLYITLDTDLDYANGYAARLTFTAVSGTSISYSFLSAPAGAYNVSAWIDMDSNTIPSIADYYGSYGATYPVMPALKNVTINGNATGIDINVAKLIANITGTITFPGNASGKRYVVAVDNDSNGSNGGQRTYYSSYVATPGPTTSMTYSLCVPFPLGDFTIYCLISMNGHLLVTGKESGDYANAKTGNSLADPAIAIGPINFSLLQIP